MPSQRDTTTYSVELTAAPESREERIATAKQLAKEVGADAKKVFQLISNAPKTISRSMSRDDAESMAELCRDAGLEVSVVAAKPETERWAPATKVVQQAQQGGAPRGRTQTRTQAEPPAGEPSPVPSASRPTSRPTETSTETEGRPSVSIGGSPYVTILSKPRRTMRYVLDTAGNGSALTIVIVLTIIVFLPFLIAAPFLSPFLPGAQILTGAGIFLALAVVPAIITSIVSLYIYGFLYFIIGQKFFQGQASQRDTRLAYAWALIAGAWITLAILIVSFPVISATNAFVSVVAMGVLGLVGFIWGLIVQSQTLGAAHNTSGWQGFATSIVAVLILSVVSYLLQLAAVPVPF